MFFIPTTSIDSDDEEHCSHGPSPGSQLGCASPTAPSAFSPLPTAQCRAAVHPHHVWSSVRILVRDVSASASYFHIRPLPVRPHSAPPSTSLSKGAYICNPGSSANTQPEYSVDPQVFNLMLAAPAIDLGSFDDSDDWLPPTKPRLYRTASVGNSWGVTSIGRGFNWGSKSSDSTHNDEPLIEDVSEQTANSFLDTESPNTSRLLAKALWNASSNVATNISTNMPPPQSNASAEGLEHSQKPQAFTMEPDSLSDSPLSRSPFESALSLTPATSTPESTSPRIRIDSSISNGHPSARSPSAPRPRRRSSQQRVSLIAGRLSLVSLEPPSPPPVTSPKLVRLGSQSSFMSVTSVAPPSPSHDKESFLGGRSISEFVIEGDIGRGAYGLVKKAREINTDGTLGPPVIIKQIIKMRILADCWKKHPKFGTIPIEIFVMSAISSTSYVLPPRRPWDPQRFAKSTEDDPDPWIEGKVVKGHPNICPLQDFFEDNHYYYLVMPSNSPERGPDDSKTPSDLFDLVESYPQGLPPGMVRSYLGQIADALGFLHSRGIVHRDVKDENVVLGRRPGSCILIDFGSSGIVRKNGWDTFSGTLDYAGPEILRGERYHGKEQDVWAFGVVAFVLLIGECPFNTAAEAQEGLESPFANASIALDERCGDGKENDGEEADGGGALGDAAALVRACLKVDLTARPTFEKILECRFLSGKGGWGMDTD